MLNLSLPGMVRVHTHMVSTLRRWLRAALPTATCDLPKPICVHLRLKGNSSDGQHFNALSLKYYVAAMQTAHRLVPAASRVLVHTNQPALARRMFAHKMTPLRVVVSGKSVLHTLYELSTCCAALVTSVSTLSSITALAAQYDGIPTIAPPKHRVDMHFGFKHTR